ncbi:unnamed protein product [Gadus morhua 'NCC']
MGDPTMEPVELSRMENMILMRVSSGMTVLRHKGCTGWTGSIPLLQPEDTSKDKDRKADPQPDGGRT